MRSSIDNILDGAVDTVSRGPICSLLEVGLANGLQICVLVPNDALEEQSIRKDSEVQVFFSGSDVAIGVGSGGSVPADNVLECTVTQIDKGAVSGVVRCRHADGDITALVPLSSLKSLGLKVASDVYAIVQPSDISLSNRGFDFGADDQPIILAPGQAFDRENVRGAYVKWTGLGGAVDVEVISGCKSTCTIESPPLPSIVGEF